MGMPRGAGYDVPMAALLFHHAQGQTPGFLTFADDLRAAGHTVHAPDLYDGRTFRDLREGVAYAEQVGFPEIIRRGSEAAKELPADIVYAGFSLGVLPAQALAQTRPGARGALFFHSCVSPSEFGTSWPEAVPLQIHMMDADEWTEVDRPAAEALVEQTADRRAVPLPRFGPPVRRPELRRLRRGGRRSAEVITASRPSSGPWWMMGRQECRFDERSGSKFDEHLEPAPEHALAVEWHGFGVHIGDPRVLHDLLVDAIAMLTRTRTRSRRTPPSHPARASRSAGTT